MVGEKGAERQSSDLAWTWKGGVQGDELTHQVSNLLQPPRALVTSGACVVIVSGRQLRRGPCTARLPCALPEGQSSFVADEITRGQQE